VPRGKKNMIHTLVEMDISKARQAIRKLRRETKNYHSLTGYIIFCVARAVEQNKNGFWTLQSYLPGFVHNKRLIQTGQPLYFHDSCFSV
jgi:hypothetical protein